MLGEILKTGEANMGMEMPAQSLERLQGEPGLHRYPGLSARHGHAVHHQHQQGAVHRPEGSAGAALRL